MYARCTLARWQGNPRNQKVWQGSPKEPRNQKITRRHSPAWWCVSAPLAAPGALAGAGLIWLWNRDLPWTPYGTFWMLPLAALARFAPLAILAAAAWRARLDPLLLDAARVYAPPRRRIDQDFEYVGYMNKQYKETGDDITLLTGTNIEEHPTERGGLILLLALKGKSVKPV